MRRVWRVGPAPSDTPHDEQTRAPVGFADPHRPHSATESRIDP